MWKAVSLLAALRRARRKIRTLEAQFAAEIDRNRRREEALLDRVLTAANQYGLPEIKRQPVQSRSIPTAAPIAQPKNALEAAQLEFYEQCAAEAGFSPSRGLLDWQKARERREMTDFDDEELVN